MKVTMSAFTKAIESLLRTDSRSSTVYLGSRMVVKATHQRRPRVRDNSNTMLVTYGKPNYAEREFIKACFKAGEPLPLRKAQLKAWPKKRKEKK